MTEEVTKTYLITRTLETPFPPDFLASKNKKYIQFRWCRGIYKDKLVGDVSLHSDIICRDSFEDSMICYINDEQGKYEKYEFNSPARTFKVWFKDFKGKDLRTQKIDEEGIAQAEADGTTYVPDLEFCLKLLLIY